MTLPEIAVQGSPRERGRQHGEQLSDRIRETREFYADIFALPDREVTDRAEQFRTAIGRFNEDYVTEIDAIAEASGVKRAWVYALNARTEILSAQSGIDLNECTSLFFRPTSILAQTWDWGRRMEELIVLMRIERPDGHVIRMIAEPGIIGKIGMNSAGIGCCLNLLRCGPLRGAGVPVHVVLRAILDSDTFAAARSVVENAAGPRASNILVGAAGGDCFDVEFAGDEALFDSTEGNAVCHTNHYLMRDGLDEVDADLSSSLSRLDVMRNLGSQLISYDMESMLRLLSDRSDRDLPVFREYVPDDMVQEVGTVCTILMDLPARCLHIRKGNRLAAPFERYSVLAS